MFRVHAIPQRVADAARNESRSLQYGHPAHLERATGYGPCRSCLETFRIGEEDRILVTYDPFESVSDYPLPGPIFVHARSCERYEGGGFPPGIRALPLMLEGCGEARHVLRRAPVTGDAIEAVIEAMFSEPEISYIHIRNAEAGCFIAHVDRA